jgi:hypothetical protein
MTTLQEGSAPGKRIDPAGERELLIHLLRTAVSRARLDVNLLETVGVSLRHRQVDVEGAMTWLKEEGLLEAVQLGPKVRQ